MDIFALTLLTITIITICGICFFIFLCAIQPKLLYYFHRKTNRTYHITASKRGRQINNDTNIENFDSMTKFLSNDTDRWAYLKMVEQSIRTGRRIEDEINEEMCNTTNNSSIDLTDLVRRYIDEELSAKSTTTTTTTTSNILNSIEV